MTQCRFASIMGQFWVSTKVHSAAMSGILYSLTFASVALDGNIPSRHTHDLLLPNVFPKLKGSC